MDVGAHDGHKRALFREKNKTFVRRPPVILRPRQLPMCLCRGPACIFISNCNLITHFFLVTVTNYNYFYFVIKLQIPLHVTSYSPTLLIFDCCVFYIVLKWVGLG